MKDENKLDNNLENDLDLEIIMGDDSELHFSDIKDSIISLKPKYKVEKENIIIPKSKAKKKKIKRTNRNAIKI